MKSPALFGTNRWNRFRYSAYAPGYDLIGRIFSNSRRKSINELGICQNDIVLIVGAGTGLDLEFITLDCQIIATDITQAMLAQLLKKNIRSKSNLQVKVMDGQQLDLPDNAVDRIILHLILAVIPDPVACIKECERVLRPSGKITVFDKFVPKGRKISLLRRMFNPLTHVLFSEINRQFEKIVSETNLVTESDEPADFNGTFRIIRLSKL